MKSQAATIAYNISPLLSKAMFFIGVAMLMYTAIDFQYPTLFGKEKNLTDFDAFYAAGKMFWEGTINQAYHYQDFFAAQERFYGANSFMPWSYPPQFDLITAALAVFPIGVAYFIFCGLTLTAYVLTIKSISSPGYFGITLFSILPAVILNIRSGQNGFLIGTLVGLFFLAFMKRRAVAGLPLGLMIIKPHLAIGIAILALASKRWSVLVIAFLTVASTAIVSTFILGESIWLAFAEGIKQTSHFLELGVYPLFRMTSIYATLHKIGTPPAVALILQSLVAISACAAIVISYFKLTNPRHLIGITAIASLYISPYNYDYDLTLLGISAAALMPDIFARAKNLEICGLFFLSWVSCGSGILQYHLMGNVDETAEALYIDNTYAVSSVALALLTLLTLRILKRSTNSNPEDSLVWTPPNVQ